MAVDASAAPPPGYPADHEVIVAKKVEKAHASHKKHRDHLHKAGNK